MGIERFFNKTLTQNRKAAAPVAGVAAWELIATFRGCIFPIGMSDSAIFSSDYIRLKITHGMYCPATVALKTGDQIVDGTVKYIIKREPDWIKFHAVLLSLGS